MAGAGVLSRLGVVQFTSRFNFLVSGKSFKLCSIAAKPKSCFDVRRYLFSDEILGLDNFKRQKAYRAEKINIVKEKFFAQMAKVETSQENSTIYTDDAKMMIYSVDTDEELKLFLRIIKKYHLQSDVMHYSTFVFGPLVLRLLHIMNKPNEALELFLDKEMDRFFDQTSSYTVLLDLLYENKMYSKLLDVFDIVIEKMRPQNGTHFDGVLLAVASCYQMNTEESLKKVLSFMKLLREKQVSTRIAVYASMLALKQQKPDVALELIALLNLTELFNPRSYYNVKMLAYTRLGRLDETIGQMKGLLQQDFPDHVKKGGEIFSDVLKEVQSAVLKSDNKRLQTDFEHVVKELHSGSHVSDQSLNEHLSIPIFRQRRVQDGFKHRDRTSPGDVGEFRRDSGVKKYTRTRPSLFHN